VIVRCIVENGTRVGACIKKNGSVTIYRFNCEAKSTLRTIQRLAYEQI